MTPKQQLELAIRLAERGASAAEIVRKTGLKAVQAIEIRRRVPAYHAKASQ